MPVKDLVTECAMCSPSGLECASALVDDPALVHHDDAVRSSRCERLFVIGSFPPSGTKVTVSRSARAALGSLLTGPAPLHLVGNSSRQ